MSKFGIWAALGLVAAAGIAIGGAEALTAARKVDAPAPVDIQDRSLVQAGAYIARTGDCVACHSALAAPFAGGLAMQTPVAPSIHRTSRPTGRRASAPIATLISRTRSSTASCKDGTPLYPAMPYPSYAIMPDADLRALYAYFMASVAPVEQPSADSTIPWPLNMRWPMAWWQLMFCAQARLRRARRRRREADARRLSGGRPGHCGARHTPRGLAYQERRCRWPTATPS